MEAQLVQLVNKGMNQDASISKASNEFAYKNYNIRITPIEDSTLLSVTNEKGPLKLNIQIKDTDGLITSQIEGKLVGYSILNDTIVLFTKSSNITDTILEEEIDNIETEGDSSTIIKPIVTNIAVDSIYKLEIDETTNPPTLKGERLFKGDLNFSDDTILETLPFYESEKSQKVYWVDGVNIPRFINLADKTKYKIPNHFDFIPSISSSIQASIVKEYNSIGVFPAGVIQYFITYYNKYGQETGIIYSSPLYYITLNDTGLDEETNSSCDFKITLSNIDATFDFIKIYSALRTSEDATPIIKVVAELSTTEIKSNKDSISVIDDNKIGYADSVSNLLALQKSFFTAKTLENKDNVLFMGNIYIESNKVKDSIIQYIKSKLTSNDITKDSPFIEFIGNKVVGTIKSFPLNNPETVKTFKYGETYRFALQFLDKYSNWTEPIWIGDKTCNIQPHITNDGRYIASSVKTKFDAEFTYLVSDYYIKQRLLIANPTISDRTILAQGIVLPTVFNYKDRVNNTAFAYQSWIARPRNGYMHYNHLDGLGSSFEDKFDDRTEIQNAVNYAPIQIDSNVKAYIISITDYHNILKTDNAKRIFVHIYKYNGLIPSKSVKDADISKMSLLNGGDINNSNYVVLEGQPSDNGYVASQFKVGETLYSKNSSLTSFNELKQGATQCLDIIKEEIYTHTKSRITNGLTGDLLLNYIKDVGKGGYLKKDVGDCPVWGTNYNWYNFGFTNIVYTGTHDIIAGSDPTTGIYKYYNREPHSHFRFLSTYIEVEPFKENDTTKQSKENNFYVDESIVTFHSPEINDVRYLIDNNQLKFRITGIVDNIKTKFDLSLATDPSGLLTDAGLVNNYNKSLEAPVNFLYKDCGYSGSGENIYVNKELVAFYPLYMWNKQDSISGISAGDLINKEPEERAAINYSALKHKIMCWYQKATHIQHINPDVPYSVIPRVFDSDEPTAVTFNYNGDTKVYQGNLDTINTTRVVKKSGKLIGYNLYYVSSNNFNEGTNTIIGGNPNTKGEPEIKGFQQSPVPIKYKSTEHSIFTLVVNKRIYKLPVFSEFEYGEDENGNPYPLNKKPSPWNLWNTYDRESNNIVISNNKTNGYRYPWIDDLFYTEVEPSDSKYINVAEKNSKEFSAYGESIISFQTPNYQIQGSYFFIGELYRDIPYSNLYGGTSNEALKALKWIPASIESPITDNNGNYISVNNTYGDTYFQNYDYLMSYPYTEEDKNSIINIVSFPCETHINVAGRYDKRYEEFNLLGARKTNFPLRNPIYSQKNNLFTYSILDDKFVSQQYANQILSSNKKGIQETVDTWTKISPASAVTTDGSFGEINKLIKLNNTIIAFQNKAISTVNFNDRTALTSTSNIQVVLGNSEKIDSISIIDSSTGCQNKMSICTTNSGIYFIDNYKKALMRINKEGIQNISGTGMLLWFRDNIQGNEVITYDSLLGDIYISNDKSCIVYNENLQTFTSFMDYQNLQWMFNIKGKTYSLWNNNINKFTFYKMFAGDYNTTFEENEYNGYEVVYKVNPEPHMDKIFSNVEYIADCYSQESRVDNPSILIQENPFDKLEVWNEYQRGITNSFKRGQYPNFAKKFRIWRVDIPRDSSNKRDRIRNPWMIMSLSKKPTTSYKMVFHDLMVKYYK